MVRGEVLQRLSFNRPFSGDGTPNRCLPFDGIEAWYPTIAASGSSYVCREGVGDLALPSSLWHGGSPSTARRRLGCIVGFHESRPGNLPLVSASFYGTEPQYHQKVNNNLGLY